MTPLRLYGIYVSHPCHAVRRMLEYKELEHEVVYLPPGLHPLAVRRAGFSGGTVPALKIGEQRVQGSLAISRALEELQPDPPLFPKDPKARAAVVAAERWGEQELQPVPRRLSRWLLKHHFSVRRDMARAARMWKPTVTALAMGPAAWGFAWVSGASTRAVRRDLHELPRLLDHVDALLAAGTIGGSVPNAADFQIATSLRLLLTFEQLEPLISDRPAGRFARELFPRYPGRMPALLPADCLPVSAVPLDASLSVP